MNKHKIRARLERALAQPSLFRVSRHHKSMDQTDGFIVGLGKKWVLIAQTLDGGYPNGLIAVRISDISSVAKDRSFETKFALTQSQPSPDDVASIQLDRTRFLLESMSSLAPLLGIQRERLASGSLWVGTFVGGRRKRFGLLEVRPDATWYDEAFSYRFREVTAVSIRDHYLTALAATAPAADTDDYLAAE